uniref:Uncharacterized protein n=1 Tax=Oryza rufipogon TaxID=4529 RepID=A0A0E0NW34_ORYRU
MHLWWFSFFPLPKDFVFSFSDFNEE